VPWTRLAAIAVLGLLGLVAARTNGVTLGVLTGVVVAAVAATDRLVTPDEDVSPPAVPS